MTNPTKGPAAKVDSWPQRWRYLPRLLKLLWELGPREVILYALITVLPGGMAVLSVALLGQMVDSALSLVRAGETFGQVATWLALLLAVDFVKTALHWAGPESLRHSWLSGDILERLKAGMQKRLLSKVSRLGLATFEHADFYDRLHRAQRGLDERMFVIIASLFRIPSAGITAIALLVYVGSVHLHFAAILLLSILPLQILGARILHRRYRLERAHTGPRRRLEYLGDLLVKPSAAAEIRLFGLSTHLFQQRQQLFLWLRDQRLALERLNLKQGLAVEAGPHLAYGVVVLGVVALIAQGQMSVGHYVAFLSAAINLRQALYLVVDASQTIAADLPYVQDLIDCLDLEDEDAGKTKPSAPQIPKPIHPPTVHFAAVSFAYPATDKPVLNGIDLTIAPNERIALVGKNGAGKTTLVKVLAGLYQPSAGQISVDGKDLTQIDPQTWRNRLGAVLQDYIRYQTTVQENIGFGDLERLEDRAALEAAALRSGADEVIAQLGAGYETHLGTTYHPQGRELSVGQWQKLALARAYLRQKAQLLVLDEPTAALDPKAEVEVYRQFLDISQNRSVLLISHRLGSARLADRILFLADGKIVETGTHDELMDQKGRYAELFSIQAEWYQ